MAHVTKMPLYQGAATESWSSYAERLNFFFKGNSIDEDTQKHALLVSSFDPATFHLVKSLVQPTPLGEKTYNELVGILKSHFNPKPSVIVSRYRFNSRNRQTMDTYVAELRSLAEHCNFGRNLEEMIRDRLVCGINDNSIQRRLLQETELTFEAAYRLATAMETAAKNVQDLQQQQKGGETIKRVEQQRSRQKSRSSRQKSKITCYRCQGAHLASDCSYRQAICHSCGKKGQVARACRSKSMRSADTAKRTQGTAHQVTIDEEETTLDDNASSNLEEDSYSLFSVVGKTKPIVVTVGINNQPISMEVVDTGAALSLLSQEAFQTLLPNYELKPTDITLRTYSGESLKVLGMMDTQVTYNSQSMMLPLLVVEGKGPSLLGRNWLEKVRLDWPRICNLATTQQDIMKEFPEVFRDQIGCYKETQAKIFVEPEAKPRFFKPRPVPYH